jgi:serine/threonine protein phosphatase PrpC
VLPGDLLMAGSDGVFDHIDEEFVPGILNAIEAFNGDVKRVAETAIRNFEEAEDEFGLLCKDNLTLALALRTDQVKAI